MSLALLQGYSSAEEEEQGHPETHHLHHNFSDDTDSDNDNGDDDPKSQWPSSYNPVAAPKSSSGSSLPSALDAFSEIAGPPEFLNHSVDDQSSVRESIVHRGRQRNRDKKDLPAGAVMEAKPQLVGIHERVRSDIEGNVPSTTSNQPPKTSTSTTNNGAQPSMCLECGVPKTYTSARGMVCPICSDRVSEDAKKKGSTVKDKEKVKRMRGQSSHATWKSETEMQLRQQFD